MFKGPNFQLGVVFSVDLVFATSGELDATGGFDLSIPDGAALVMPLDPTESNTASL